MLLAVESLRLMCVSVCMSKQERIRISPRMPQEVGADR